MQAQVAAKRRVDAGDGSIVVRHRNKGALHDLLLRACPPNEFGEKSITVLAIKLGLSAWAVHKWANRGKLPPNRARDIVDIADPRAAVTLADFTPFVYA